MPRHDLEILVATMHQTDFSKVAKMNIRCDAVFANQADRQDYREQEIDGHRIRMITTDQRGVGRNRNQALLYAEAEYLLFGDDDMVYADDCAEQVVQAFASMPEADVILFAVDLTKNGEVCERISHGKGRLPYMKSWKYGAVSIAARRESLERANLWYHLEFGGGCRYSSGEDSLFLHDCYKKGLKVCTHPYVLGTCETDSSTWFQGYTEKYFLDKGCWLAVAMPKLCRVAVLPLAVKWRNQNPDFGVWKIAKLMWQGISAFRSRAR